MEKDAMTYDPQYIMDNPARWTEDDLYKEEGFQL